MCIGVTAVLLERHYTICEEEHNTLKELIPPAVQWLPPVAVS